MSLIATHNIRIGDDGLIVGIGSGTVGDEARITLGIHRLAADLMGDRFAEALTVLRDICNNIPLLQSGGVDVLNKDQVAGIKVRRRHGVRIDNVRFVSK